MYRLARVYAQLLRAYWALALEYRAQILIWFLSGTFPLMMMGVWLSVAANRTINGFDANTFVAYYLAVALIRRLTWIWILHSIQERIRTGELSNYLLRPLDYAHHVLSEIIATRVYNAVTIGTLIALIALLIPGQQFVLAPGNLLAFAVCIVLGFAFEFVVQYLCGTLAFWTTQVENIHACWWMIKSLLGGFIVPMSLLPAALQPVVRWLPFDVSMGMPAEILTGLAGPERIAHGLAVGLVWTLALWLLSRWVWARGLRSYGAVGA
jgi:ABC-2 type transport system permease protein